MSNVISLVKQSKPDIPNYNDLMELVESNDSFFFSDQLYFGAVYRVFLYRISSFSDYENIAAFESRGSMFLIKDSASNDLHVPQLVCCPMKKFFNLNENPFTMDLDLSNENIEDMFIKADGSLISTFPDIFNNLQVKSKGSLHSVQAQATRHLLKNKLSDLALEISELTIIHKYTVNMELVAPDNRIVISYDVPDLIVLNLRHCETGELITSKHHHVLDKYSQIKKHWVQTYQEHPLTSVFSDSNSLLTQANELTSIEGFVVKLRTGELFKLKNSWYLSLHRTRDSVASDKLLFAVTINDASDDLRGLFYDSPVIMGYIEQMHEYVVQLLNSLTTEVNDFYDTNKHLDRKSYAIKGQLELSNRMWFNLAMCLYQGKIVDFKQVILDNYKDLLPNPPIIPIAQPTIDVLG